MRRPFIDGWDRLECEPPPPGPCVVALDEPPASVGQSVVAVGATNTGLAVHLRAVVAPTVLLAWRGIVELCGSPSSALVGLSIAGSVELPVPLFPHGIRQAKSGTPLFRRACRLGQVSWSGPLLARAATATASPDGMLTVNHSPDRLAAFALKCGIWATAAILETPLIV